MAQTTNSTKSFVMNFKGYTPECVTEFVCNNYKSLGFDQRVYTCCCALQFLYNTGRLNGMQHNVIKSMSGNSLYRQIIRIANKRGNEMFAYSQHHFESEWAIFIHKSLSKAA